MAIYDALAASVATGSGMKVILAVHHFLPRYSSGAELLAFRTAQWMIARGHNVRVVCIESIDDSSLGDRFGWLDEIYKGIPVRRLSFHLSAIPETLRFWFDHPSLEKNFLDLFSSERPDLFHLVGGYLLGIAPLRTARLLNIPTVITLTDFWFLCHTVRLLRGDGSLCTEIVPIECLRCIYDGKRTFKWLDQRAPRLVQQFWQIASQYQLLGNRFKLPELIETLEERQVVLREALGSADAVVTLTHFMAEMYAKNQFETRDWKTIPLSLDLDPLSDPPVHRIDQTIHFGYLGQVVPVKGVDVLVRAFRKLDRSLHGARLTIFGALDAEPDYVRQLRLLANDDSDIAFAGRYDHSSVIEILGTLDSIIVPSNWYENGPTVILEAFAGRVPVIGTNLGGIAEIVQHEVNGLLFERGDVDDLARQLQRLLDEPELLPCLRRNIPLARTVDEEMSELSRVYEQVLGKQSAFGEKVA